MFRSFKYFGCLFNKSVTDGAECRKKVVNGKNVVVSPIRSLVKIRSFKLEYVRVLHKPSLDTVVL